MPRRGVIKKFLLGFIGGLQTQFGLNPNQRLRAQEYGRVSITLVIFVIRWTCVAAIFRLVFGYVI